MTSYLLVFLVVFGVNLMPAFGPPTWSILVLYRLRYGFDLLPLVLIGAAAAALGRFVLGSASGLLYPILPQRSKRNLAAARAVLEGRSQRTIFALALFALSPMPSAQLFEAAGLAKLRLWRFTLAFFAGRLVSYTLYLLATREVQERGLSDEFEAALRSPGGILLQIAMLALLVAFTQIDWQRLNGRR